MKQHELNGATERLFDSDAYLVEFTAEVISCEDAGKGQYSVILDRTAFFPEGGGQPGDTGFLTTADGLTAKVLDTRESGSAIIHTVDKPVPCGKIAGKLNFPIRYERMRNHSGEHLLSGLAHSRFGCTNVGFHLNDEAVTVDFDRQLTREQLLELERLANDIIAENVRITAFYPSTEELASLDYRSKLDLTENVRIVKIGEYDLCACCAPHVASTSEVGMLLITDSLNYKGGTRLTMVCGKNACNSARTALSNTREICGMLSAKPAETAQAVARFMGQADAEKARSSALCNAYIDLRISRISRTDGDIMLFEPALDRNSLRRLVDRAADLCGGICAGFTGSDEEGWTYIMISRSRDLKALSRELNEKMNGKGGGSAQMIQGTAGATKEELEKIFL